MEWIGYLGPAGTYAPRWVVLGVATDVCGDPALRPARHPELPPSLLLPSSSSSGSFYRGERRRTDEGEEIARTIFSILRSYSCASGSPSRARRTIRRRTFGR
ncbi:hypothetical protein Trydic_g2240 [Trypoxylus dichotomus]